jgi:DNA mismatch repair protein MutS
LQEIRDLKRLLARLVLGRCNPRDLLQLKDSLLQLPKLQILLNRCRAPLFLQMQQQWDNLTEVAMLIQLAIADEPPVHVADGGVIRVGYHAELDELRSLQHQGKSWLAKLEVDERQRTGIANLKVRFNNIFGYYIEVTRSNLKQVPADFERKQTLVNAERFITPKLKEYEEKVLHAAERILVLEQRLFSELLQQIGAQQQRISKMSELLAQLDVCQNRGRFCRQDTSRQKRFLQI